MSDITKIQEKVLKIIDRRIDKILEQGDIGPGMDTTIQNYAKTLVMVAKEQREALKGFDPRQLTDDEIDKMLKESEDNETAD